MRNVKKLWKDVRRSLGLLLALVMLASVFVSIPVGAAETLKIVDTGKMIGVGYKPADDTIAEPEFVFHTYKTVVIENTGGVSMEENNSPVLKATVYVTIDGNEYEVMQYSSAPVFDMYWDVIGISKFDDCDAYKVNMAPVFYQNGAEITDVRREEYCSSNNASGPEANRVIYSTSADNFGFSDAIIDYLNEKGITEWEDILDFLESEEVSKNYTVKYTLSDSDNNSATFTQSGAVMVDYDDYDFNPPNSYLYGKRLGYNRIEDLSSYHQNDVYNYIKMFKGDIYVDADKISELEGSLILPNKNNSLLYYLNSVYVNGDVLYNDGYSNNTIDSGYNLLNSVLPEFEDTEDDAVMEFINIMTGKTYVEDDFSLQDDYYSYLHYYENINFLFGHTFTVDDKIINVNAYNQYVYGEDDPALITECEETDWKTLYNNTTSDEQWFSFESAVLPEIKVADMDFDSAAEYSDYLNKYYVYLKFISNAFEVYDNVYDIMAGDNVLTGASMYNVNFFRLQSIAA